MWEKSKIISYFKKSLAMNNTQTNDQAFTYSDEDLWDILIIATLAHNPSYVIDTVPDNEVYFILLKGKEEVYYRLATSSAPLYPIEAEGASLRKDYRFEHYMSLIRRVEQEYNSLWAKFENGQGVQVADLIIDSYHYRRRNYNQANAPKVEILRCIPDKEYIDIEWSKFKVFAGLFHMYLIYIDTSQIYNEFDDEINPSAKLVAELTNIHKNRVRINNLVANTKYHILIVSEDRNGLKGYVETELTTLPIKYEEV